MALDINLVPAAAQEECRAALKQQLEAVETLMPLLCLKLFSCVPEQEAVRGGRLVQSIELLAGTKEHLAKVKSVWLMHKHTDHGATADATTAARQQGATSNKYRPQWY